MGSIGIKTPRTAFFQLLLVGGIRKSFGFERDLNKFLVFYHRYFFYITALHHVFKTTGSDLHQVPGFIKLGNPEDNHDQAQDDPHLVIWPRRAGGYKLIFSVVVCQSLYITRE